MTQIESKDVGTGAGSGAAEEAASGVHTTRCIEKFGRGDRGIFKKSFVTEALQIAHIHNSLRGAIVKNLDSTAERTPTAIVVDDFVIIPVSNKGNRPVELSKACASIGRVALIAVEVAEKFEGRCGFLAEPKAVSVDGIAIKDDKINITRIYFIPQGIASGIGVFVRTTDVNKFASAATDGAKATDRTGSTAARSKVCGISNLEAERDFASTTRSRHKARGQNRPFVGGITAENTLGKATRFAGNKAIKIGTSGLKTLGNRTTDAIAS